MKELTFENVISGNFELVYTVSGVLSERNEVKDSYNQKVRGFIEGFVETFRDCLTIESEKSLDQQLVAYNKLIVDLIMANFSDEKPEENVRKFRELHSDLYSLKGEHYEFIATTRKTFDQRFKPD